MSDLLSYHIPEAIRIEVIGVSHSDEFEEIESHVDENVQRFSIDPQLTNYSVLHSIITRAFNVKSDLSLNYLRRDLNTFVSLKSDWDLDAAYLNSSKPFLLIRMTPVERQNSLTDWDIITVADLTRAAQIAANQTTSVANTFLHKMEKIVSKAFSRSATSSPIDNNPSPLTEKQYYTYLDGQGRIKSIRELRISIFRRGVDPVLRRAVWKHLLNVYPPGLTGNQRYEYIKSKAEQYNRMKTLWASMIGSDETVDCTLNMVRKDVLRTDRMHPFYSSSTGLSSSTSDLDNNPNVVSLLNILTTFALNHGVKYCQGMSDLASPLLYAMKDEAQAYICFCGLMLRLRENFTLDGEAISCKFDHLSRLLQYYDGDFYSYLKQVGAQDLLFCYRWILLELKREFPFDCALTMLEVTWSSIPPVLIDDLPLFDEGFRYDIDNGTTQDALAFEADLAAATTIPSRTNHYHQGSSDENDGDVEDDEDEDDTNVKINPHNGFDSNNCQTNFDKNNCGNDINQQQQLNLTRKSLINGTRNVKIPIVNRRYPRNGHFRYGDQLSLMNHSLPEYGTRTFECGDLENSGSIRINGFYLSHHIDHQRQRSSISASSAISNHPSSSKLKTNSVNKAQGNSQLFNHQNSNGPNTNGSINSSSSPSTTTTRNSLPHILKGTRPLRTIRFLPKILSNDSREIDSPDEEESVTKSFNFPPKLIEKGFSIDSDGDCRRLNSFESIGGSSKNSSVDIDEEGDPSATVNHHDLRGCGGVGGGGLAGIKGGENNTSTSSSSSSSSAAVRLRCQQRRRLFCRLGSSGGSGHTVGGGSGGSFGRDNSEPSSPSSFYSGSFVYPNGSNTPAHEVETDCEQDLIVHCNGEKTDSHFNRHQQDWIIPRGLARSVSYECLKNLTITPGSPTLNGGTIINTNINEPESSSTNGLVILRESSSNTGSSHRLNTVGLTPTTDTVEAGALLGSRNSSTQGLEKERSEGYGSGSDPSDLISEVHSAFGGTIDGAKSDSSSCSSLVILNSNGSSTNESNNSPPSSSPSSSPSNNATNDMDNNEIHNGAIKTDNGNAEKPLLPSPSELGSSNAFMLFLCLTILLQHRDKIISSGFDCNEIAVYFDSYIRRHNVQSVLENGRSLFHSYLNQWQQTSDNDHDLSHEFPPTFN